eukprot:648047-Hanusia_phi.AAC.1
MIQQLVATKQTARQYIRSDSYIKDLDLLLESQENSSKAPRIISLLLPIISKEPDQHERNQPHEPPPQTLQKFYNNLQTLLMRWISLIVSNGPEQFLTETQKNETELIISIKNFYPRYASVQTLQNFLSTILIELWNSNPQVIIDSQQRAAQIDQQLQHARILINEMNSSIEKIQPLEEKLRRTNTQRDELIRNQEKIRPLKRKIRDQETLIESLNQ